MHLVVTIDTEEDNWGDYTNTSFGIENIRRIPSLQKTFDEYNIRPTYLVTYPVATNKESVKILKDILQQGKCEIGMHCHPWSTPPFKEERNSHNSMMCNLPYDLQYKKMNELHKVIGRNIGIDAKTFRAGRWGYNAHTAVVLQKLSYRVDTSITPFTDWSEYYGPNYFKITPKSYWFNAPEIFTSVQKSEMVEIPATIGYLQDNYELCNLIDRLLTSRLGRKFRMKGLLSKMKLINKVWLSPENSHSNQMIKLTKVMLKKKYRIVNMFFHSTSLQGGLSIFVKTIEDEIRFSNRLREYFTFTCQTGIKCLTLSEAADMIQGDGRL